MSKTLKEKTTKAIAWSFIDKFGQQGINLVVGIILARYFLSPTDYGLVGMIAIFNALGYALIDSGFSNALIRKSNVTQADLSSVFYFNICISVFLYITLFLCAPLIAAFYKQPLLTSLTRVMALTIPLMSLTLIQTTLLSKEVRFHVLAKANLIALVCSTAVSLTCAFQGLGVWVLAIQPLCGITMRTICLWLFNSWRPSAVYSHKSIKELWRFSSNLLASSVISTIFNNIHALLIGKLYPLREVGFYTQGYKYSDLPYSTVIGGIQTAVYPVMASISHDEERLKKVFRKTIRASAFIIFPILLGLVAVAHPLIYTLIGEKWLPIVPYMRVFCIGYVFLSIAAIFGNVFYVKGLSFALLKFNILYRIFIIISIILTFRVNVMALVIGWGAASILHAAITTSYARKKIQYSLKEFAKDIFPYFTLATLMVLGIYSLTLWVENIRLLLVLQVASGTLFYLGANYLLGSKIFREVVEMLRVKR